MQVHNNLLDFQSFFSSFCGRMQDSQNHIDDQELFSLDHLVNSFCPVEQIIEMRKDLVASMDMSYMSRR